MTTQTMVGSGEVCRLTVYGPKSRVELAVPAHVPLADLLPTFLGHLGQELATTGLEHGGWILQRLGEPPLEEDLGTAALGLYDGDIVYLRPRSEQLPPVDFDDLVDGVAAGIAERGDAWRPESTRWLCLAAGALALVAGLLVAPAAGSGALVATVAGAAAVVLLLAGTAAARSFGDGTAGALLGAAAIPFAAIAGLAVPMLDRPVALAGLPTAPGLMAAGVFVGVAAVMARLGTGRLQAALAGVTVAAVLATVAGLLGTHTAPGGRAAAAILLPVVLLLGFLTPSVAAKLAGLRIRPLPANPAEFQQDVDPEPAGPLLARAAVADAYIAATYVALAIVCIGCLAVLARLPGRAPALLLLAASTLVLLHSRELVGARQRVAMLAPGVIGPLALILVDCRRHPGGLRLAVLLGLLLLALLACVAAKVLPGRRLLPHWGLIGDITHWVAAAAIIPLALSVAGVFALVRGG
jgi:type VII secretion integral membrane protein EccD